MRERSTWVDYGKGAGIVLMVYAHLLSSAYHNGVAVPQKFFELSDSMVYSFHMPFFFFLSGLFAESSLKKRGVKAYLKDKALRILYPYLVWSVIQVSVEILFSSQSQMGATLSDLFAVIYQPWGQFWFLYALLWMYIAYAAFSFLGKSAAPALFALGALGFFFPLPVGAFSLGAASARLIFFAAGVLFKEAAMKAEAKGQPLWLVVLLLAALFGSTYCAFTNLIPPQRLDNARPFDLLFFSALGIFAFSALSQYLAKRRRLPVLETLGKYSLEIYLVHMLAGVGARMVLLLVFGVQNWLVHIIIGTCAALAVPVFLRRISERMNFPYLFEWKLRN